VHTNISQLYQIAQKPTRRIIGLMSGTSMDGLDIALCAISGSGMQTKVVLEQFMTVPYTANFKDKLLTVFSKDTISLAQLCMLHPWIGLEHATCINQALTQWKIVSKDVDLIASHGQTVYHAPKSLHPDDAFGSATLQIGEADHLSVATGIITISDFRQKHIAAGGEGAPLAVYGDYLLCHHPTENRVLLNIGGIANFTYLPAACSIDQVFSTDTGPGNTLMDAYIRKCFNDLAYDQNGDIAKTGRMDEELLMVFKNHAFFNSKFPKTIGPELFNLEFIVAAQIALGKTILPNDLIATLNRFTAETIAEAIQKFVPSSTHYTIYISGGGMHNPVLMENLHAVLPNVPIQSSNEIGIMPDAKEAILFALLANEAVAGTPLLAGGNATKMATTFGKISFPL
jgi:anhydro-N-acetylmuramic acid kinase